MSFSEEPRSFTETRKRTSGDYIKFTSDHKVTLRILNSNARTVWKHWVPEANDRRGLGFVCPNVTAQTQICPIEKSLVGLDKESDEVKNKRARRKFIVNVLDRTAHTTCAACNTFTAGKKCSSCGTTLKGAEFKPLNRVKILEQGPRLFNQGLNAVERMQKEDFDAEITDYDINFISQGEGRDRVINPVPLEPKPLEEDALLDETGEPQKLFDLDLLSEPPTLEEIEAILRGATIDELNAIRGVA